MYWRDLPFVFGEQDDCPADDTLLIVIPEGIAGYAQLLNQLGVGLGLPSYDGWNWDAMEDYLRDLDWITQSSICIYHEALPLVHQEQDLEIYLQVLLTAFAANQERRQLRIIFPYGSKSQVESLVSKEYCERVGNRVTPYDERAFDFFTERDEAALLRSRVVNLGAGMLLPQELFDRFAERLGFHRVIRNWYEFRSSFTDLRWMRDEVVVLVHGDLPFQNNIEWQSIYLDVLLNMVELVRSVPDLTIQIAFPESVRCDIATRISDMKEELFRRCGKS